MFQSEVAGLAAKRATDENLADMRLFVNLMKGNLHDLVKLTEKIARAAIPGFA